jgi:ComF family protein
VLEHPLSRIVVLYKDSGERRYAAVLASLLADCASDELAWAEAIVPVPATRAALRRRGFDHVELIARLLGELSGAPVARCLQAAAPGDQRTLDRAGRFAHAHGAFSLLPDAVPPERALVLDDVMTTGATADAAAHLLLASGTAEVRLATVARACSARPDAVGG